MPFGSTPTSLAESTNGNSHSSADNDDYNDDDDDDDWGDFVSEASPTSEFGPGLKTGSKPVAVVPNAPVIPASATFAPSSPPLPPPAVKLSLGPLQPTIKSKTTLESDKVAAIIAALPDLSFMLDG